MSEAKGPQIEENEEEMVREIFSKNIPRTERHGFPA
jgi:hypothetical protein